MKYNEKLFLDCETKAGVNSIIQEVLNARYNL